MSGVLKKWPAAIGSGDGDCAPVPSWSISGLYRRRANELDYRGLPARQTQAAGGDDVFLDLGGPCEDCVRND